MMFKPNAKTNTDLRKRYFFEDSVIFESVTGVSLIVDNFELVLFPEHTDTDQLSQNEQSLSKCLGCFSVDWLTYQTVIQSNHLFHLYPQIRGRWTHQNEFDDFHEIQLLIALHPDHLNLVGDIIATADSSTLNFQKCKQIQLANIVFSSESWIVLSGEQYNDEQVKITGYQTAWNYFNLRDIVQGRQSNEDVIKSLLEFFQESADLAQFSGEGLLENQDISKIVRLIFQILPNSVSMVDATSSSNNRENILSVERLVSHQPEVISTAPLMDTVISLFEQEDWQFTLLDDLNVLRAYCCGQSGEWEVYTQVNEARKQVLVYSLFPFTIPSQQRILMAEFIARANYNLAIGNFELSLNEGTVRYKTSIDVEKSNLDCSLVRNLVAANIVVMDTYFPGILKIVSGSASVISILQEIEVG